LQTATRLLHRHRGERGKADDVAGGEDVRHLGAKLRVDLDVAARVGFDADRGEAEARGGARATSREQKVRAFQRAPVRRPLTGQARRGEETSWQSPSPVLVPLVLQLPLVRPTRRFALSWLE
jgi:hypothetical protein